MTNKPMLSVERQCKECGSKSLSWDTHSKTTSGVAEGRLRSNEVQCLFVLGCNECSETIMVVDADRVAGELNKVRALLDKPVERVIDLDALDWESVKEAAAESKWMPPEYMRNEWVADVCEFLRAGPAAQHHGDPVAWQYRVSAGPATGWSLWHDGKGEEFKNSYQVETRPLYAEQPAPVALYPRCTILKECNTRASSSATALKSQGDPKAVEIPEHTMRSVMDAIQKARGFPALTSNQCHALAESLNYVARLNGVNP